MTAYGRATGTAGGKQFSVEIKSVNNRYFDCAIKVPRSFGFLEEKIKNRLSGKGISRGKVEVFVGITVIDTPLVNVAVDEGLARGYLDALYRLRDEFSLRDDVSVMNLARTPDILVVSKPEEDADRDYEDLLPILDEAIDAFISAREREGENLRTDLLLKRDTVAQLVDKVEKAAGEQVVNYRTRLYEKLRETLESLGADPAAYEARMMTECALFADKVAVDEELVRLRSHIEDFERALNSSEPVGRRLDFLLQEMNREVNTTGSKCTELSVTNLVVELKCELEKIREQIQNIE